MALSSGAGPHSAWLTVNGATFPLEHGSVEQHATRKTSTFSAAIPMSFPGAEATLATLGDNETTVTVLTRGNQATLFTGEIDTVEFGYIGRIIRVTGRDKSAKLHENKTSEKWQNKKGSDIVQDLAGRIGLSVQLDSSALMAGKQLEQDYVRLSDNTSFAYVIHKLAQFDGARWWVDQNGTLQYRIGNSPAGIYTINYVPATSGPIASDATVLQVRRNVQAGKTIKVKVKSWHPKKKEIFEYESNVEGNGGPINHSYHVPNLLQDHVQQYAKSRADEIARHEVTIHATVVGDPSVNVAMGLQLTGTGFWDQQYEMDTVHHEFGMSGHRTSITARSGKGSRSAS
jgi:phage protein D